MKGNNISFQTAAKFIWQPFLFITMSFVWLGNKGGEIKTTKVNKADSLIDFKSPDMSLLRLLVVDEINSMRKSAGLQPVQIDDTLNWSSQDHLNGMLSYHFFDHSNPRDIKYPDLKKRIDVYSKRYLCLSENLLETFPFQFTGNGISYITKKKDKVYQYLDPKTNKQLQVLSYKLFAKEIVGRWANSPIHYQNMMNKKYRFVGLSMKFPNYYYIPSIEVTTVVANFGGCKL